MRLHSSFFKRLSVDAEEDETSDRSLQTEIRMERLQDSGPERLKLYRLPERYAEVLETLEKTMWMKIKQARRSICWTSATSELSKVVAQQ